MHLKILFNVSKIQTNTVSAKNEHAIDYTQNSFSVGIKRRRYSTRRSFRLSLLLLYNLYFDNNFHYNIGA